MKYYAGKPVKAYRQKGYDEAKCYCPHCCIARPERAEEKRRMLEVARRALRGKTV